MRLMAPILTATLLAGCASTPPVQTQAPPPPPRPATQTQVPPTEPAVQPVAVAGRPVPQIMEGPGLAGIIREQAPVLIRRFGEPRLTVVEGDMRKLQFRGEACVLDIFLYPIQPGAEPVATWVEARRSSDGAAVDRFACIQALSL